LRVAAIVNPTNESLMDKNPISERIFEVAGPELKEECKLQIRSKPLYCLYLVVSHMWCLIQTACRTGEAKLSNGFSLPAR